MSITGYAAGSYCKKCNDCHMEFTGDKRAFRCETCANKIAPVILFLDKISGMCSSATNPRTQHFYEKYELLVRIEMEARDLLAQIQSPPTTPHTKE